MQLKIGRTKYELLVNRNGDHTYVSYYVNGSDVGESEVPSHLSAAKDKLVELVKNTEGNSAQISFKIS